MPKKFEEFSIQINEIYRQIDKLVEQEKARAEGLRQKYRPMSAEEIALKGEFAGSLFYAAPEQFSPSKVLTCQCDVYQLGAVSYAMITGKPAVKGKNISAVMGQILFGQKPHISDTIKGSPVLDALGDLIYRMMENDPEQRITIEDVRKELEEILIEYEEELQKEPSFGNPVKLKTTKDILQRSEKVEYAKMAHHQMLPQMQKWIDELKKQAAQKKQESIDSKINTLETIYLWWSEEERASHFKFRCPTCSRKLQLPFDKIGKKIRCPNCQQKLITKKKEQ